MKKSPKIPIFEVQILKLKSWAFFYRIKKQKNLKNH